MKKTFNNIKNVSLFLHSNLKKNTNILISGGKTIQSVLKELVILNKKLYFKTMMLSDERIVSNNSNLRNDRMIKKFIKFKQINVKNFINYKPGRIKKKEIDKISEKLTKLKFNYGILSLGSNCHLASIFDFNDKRSANFYHVKNSPKIPKNRVTVSKEVINNCKKIFLIADTKTKKKELKKIFNLSFFKKIKKKTVLVCF